MVIAGKLERDHTAISCEKNNVYNYFQIKGLAGQFERYSSKNENFCRIYTTKFQIVVFFENWGCLRADFDYHALA